MLDSYFFIPADREDFLAKRDELDVDYFVIDLEDSVSESNKNLAFKNVMDNDFNKQTFFRIPFLDSCYSNKELEKLSLKSNGKIILPKVNEISDIESIYAILKNVKNLQLILLIETPRLYIELKEVLTKFSKDIIAIGFGSHDFTSMTGIKHDLEHLKHFKLELNVIAKAFNKTFIDGVDVNIRNLKYFIRECQFAYNIGAEGKFMIHPNQIYAEKKVKYLTDEKLVKYKAIYNRIALLKEEEIDILEFEGKIYEKPHLKKINKIMSKIFKT